MNKLDEYLVKSWRAAIGYYRDLYKLMLHIEFSRMCF